MDRAGAKSPGSVAALAHDMAAGVGMERRGIQPLLLMRQS